MPQLSAVIIGTIGVVLLMRGLLPGLVWVVWAALIQWPQLAAISWPGARQSDPPRRSVARGLFWALTVVLLWVLIVGVGLVVSFLLGMGSLLGLVIGATVVVLSARGLYWIEPRGPVEADSVPD